VAKREASRSKAAYRLESAMIEVLDAALRTETQRIGLWLDTSTLSVDETVEQIVERGPTEGCID
jgi:hypothetical protein